MRRSLTLALAALAGLMAFTQTAQAQTTCNRGICTVRLASDRQVVDGCGEHATPGRMKVIFESTNSSATRTSFPTAGYFLQATNDFRSSFSDWEWRTSFLNSGRWTNPASGRISFAGGVLGENIIEVRPKAGAHVWTNRNPSNPNQGPGEIVVPVFSLSDGSNYRGVGSAYFLFMGGKGCARVNEGGEDIGGVQ